MTLFNGLSLIYGVNGAGKSTWVKNIKTNGFLIENYNIKVFDEDYILNHIYISDNSGHKSVSVNEVNRAKVYIGDSIKKEYELLGNIGKKLKEIKNKLSVEVNTNAKYQLKSFLKDYGIEDEENLIKFNQEISKLVNDTFKEGTNIFEEYDYNFNEEEFKKWLENIVKNSFNDFEYNSLEVENFINMFKYKKFLKPFSQDIITKLYEHVFSQNGYINIKINKNINDFIISNKVFQNFLSRYKEKNIVLNKDENNWVIEGIKIHSKNNKCICLFCLSTSLENKYFVSMLNSEIENTKFKINEILKNMEQILNSFHNYKRIFASQGLINIWNSYFENLFIFLNSQIVKLSATKLFF